MATSMRSARAVTISGTCCSSKPCSLLRTSRLSAARRATRVRYTRDEDTQAEVDAPPAERLFKPSPTSRLSSKPEYSAFRTEGETSWEGSAMSYDSDFVQQAKAYWNRVEDKPAFVAITAGSILLAWIGSYTISAVERIPLVPKMLEFVGLVYTSTFFYKYVLFADGRAQLQREADALIKRMTTAAESAAESANSAAESATESANSTAESAAGSAKSTMDRDDNNGEMAPSVDSTATSDNMRGAKSMSSEEESAGDADQKTEQKVPSAEERTLHRAEGVDEGHTSTTADGSAQRQDVTPASWDDGTDYAGSAMRDSGDDFDEDGSPAVLSPEALQEAMKGTTSDDKAQRDSQQEKRKQKDMPKDASN